MMADHFNVPYAELARPDKYATRQTPTVAAPAIQHPGLEAMVEAARSKLVADLTSRLEGLGHAELTVVAMVLGDLLDGFQART